MHECSNDCTYTMSAKLDISPHLTPYGQELQTICFVACSTVTTWLGTSARGS